ncbi:hypothetical protein PAECIP111802_01057 [Paenibacillus allorhizosphaerae]|uniref:DUF1292 domain-containing protein n=2 Tax=Paenibacillus allorhizosphaerae TaxID=2849866 RepID=A0ABM8VD57_9BACL|nr:hypothetical protein PAECIP111802_01057 [Paenibacillus allorhizosphaerae]
MQYNKGDGYVGKVGFQVEGHNLPYEITIFSKDGKDWGYGLFFLKESGNEEQLEAVEELLEDNDEVFELLVNAARSSL